MYVPNYSGALSQFFSFQSTTILSSQKNPRLIDGIVLTKFDTIDDKVMPCNFDFFLFQLRALFLVTKARLIHAKPHALDFRLVQRSL